jgi:murein DD-endopeptidase MepM/ murein hydrolase activator NlpD
MSAPSLPHGGRRAFQLAAAGFVAIAGVVAITQRLPAPEPALPAARLVSPPPVALAQLPVELAPREVMLKVRYGDSLSRLFDRHSLSQVDLNAIMSLPEAAPRLRRVMPGDAIQVTADQAGSVRGLKIELDETRTLEVKRTLAAFEPRIIERPLTRQLRYARGTIDSSLFASAIAAGLSTQLTMGIASIFGYDIDFLQDLRAGDEFAVAYEELWRDGEKLRDGDILAAEFFNSGRALRAVRYVLPDGGAEYFAPDGSSMRKALTRNPLDFARISSSFSLRRHHPILNKVRAHRGVDYAAPTGTPVRAAGDGKITFRGVKGGYGNVVVIRHGATFSTLYAHLSRFAGGVVNGAHVRQDQVIGYVGQTGLATAPHLHYEVFVDGVQRNPRTVKLPDAAPIGPELREDFSRQSAALLQLLEREQLRIASAGTRT